MFGDVPVTGAEPVHVFIRQPLAGGDDGVAQNATFVIVPGPAGRASSLKRGYSSTGRGVMADWARTCVFRTFAAAAVDDGAEVEDIPAKMFPDGVGRLAQFFQRFPAEGYQFFSGAGTASLSTLERRDDVKLMRERLTPAPFTSRSEWRRRRIVEPSFPFSYSATCSGAL